MEPLSAIRQLETKLESYREILSRTGAQVPLNFAGTDEIWSGAKRAYCDLQIALKAPVTRKPPEVVKPPRRKQTEREILDELGF